MDPTSPVNPDSIKQLVVEALNIGHLTLTEQEKIMNDLGAALIERATYAVLMQLPKEDFEKLDKLADAERDAEMVEVVRKSVPNAQEIVDESIKTGVEEYKKLVNEQVAARTAATTVPQAI